MLALLDSNNHVSLFKRPEKGIWGGLYSLPEFESRRACSEQLASYGLNTSGLLQTGTEIKHGFSHFNLCITPLFLSLHPEKINTLLARSASDPDTHDLGVIMSKNKLYNLSSPAQQPAIGVPAPIQKILDRLSIEAKVKLSAHKPSKT